MPGAQKLLVSWAKNIPCLQKTHVLGRCWWGEPRAERIRSETLGQRWSYGNAALSHLTFAPETVPHLFGAGVHLLAPCVVRDSTKVTQLSLESCREHGSIPNTGIPGMLPLTPAVPAPGTREGDVVCGGSRHIHLQGACCTTAATTALPLQPLFCCLQLTTLAVLQHPLQLLVLEMGKFLEISL